ncbi:hypothetical protein [Amphritea pacifica]|uniref:hypothetical protein n=1 Tax=Amphritea pacifica TaxID=2811233 RepID=UPI001966AC17|nr:hypothetical protein [Amphritea pacifica]MBN1006413.1 hypothetical protein [Amphritea pacifica]
MQIKKLNAYTRWGYIPESVIIPSLNDKERHQFDIGIENLLCEREKVEKFADGTYDELLLFSKTPGENTIFWCFNNWSEPLLLNRQLPETISLCAGTSAHLLTQKWWFKTRFHEHLVGRYLNTLEQIQLIHSDMIIGGNCQGAPIAESLAIRIKEKTGYEPLLITLDYVPRKQYDGPMFMMFGEDSTFNPFNCEIEPLPIFQKRKGDWGIGILNAMHGQYFREPTLFELRDYILTATGKFLTRSRFEHSFF